MSSDRPKTARELLAELNTPERLAEREANWARRAAVDAEIEAELVRAAREPSVCAGTGNHEGQSVDECDECVRPKRNVRMPNGDGWDSSGISD